MGDWRRWRFHQIHTLYHTTVILTDGAFFSLELIYCFGTDIPIFNEMETSILKTFHQYYPLGLLVAVVGAVVAGRSRPSLESYASEKKISTLSGE